MNSSLATADSATHFKIAIVAIAASALFMAIAITARGEGGNAFSVQPQWKSPGPIARSRHSFRRSTVPKWVV